VTETRREKMKTTEILTNEEVRALSARIRQVQDSKEAREDALNARNELVMRNILFVKMIVKDYEGRGVSRSDLIQEGCRGLIEAAERHDPSFGNKFTTYAVYQIKRYIKLAIYKNNLIRLPMNVVQYISNWKRAAREIKQKTGRDDIPSEEIIERVGLTKRQERLVKKAFNALSIQDFNHNNGEKYDPPDQNEKPGITEKLIDLSILTNKQQRKVIELRYGLNGKDPMTYEEIGAEIGKSRQWAKVLETKALGKLREVYQDKYA
jgi:RNA polymerase primary sigma factor